MNRESNPGPVVPDRIVDPRSQPFVKPEWRGHLPHLYKKGCTYFVTFNLFDAVPKHLKKRRLRSADGDSFNFAANIDPQPNTGGCLLKMPELASIVEKAFLHFQGKRYAISAWCVMPNHVHVVVTPFSGFTLSAILHSWKSFSAHEINSRLGRKGRLWEDETFDHLVRSELDFERFVCYTEMNPVTAGLCDHPAGWPFSSARFRKGRD